jgi:RNA-directed DNA polymerase
MRSKKRLAALLKVNLSELQQLAYSKSNYRIFLLPAETCPFIGSSKKERWVQQPKSQLRSVHSSLQRLLTRINPPDYAHGAVKGRSYRTNGVHHKDSDIVATYDIRGFYSATSKSRVYTFFRTILKCSHDVASILASICCVTDSKSCGISALPTGSPLSPILSLYANSPMFGQLKNLAESKSLIFSAYVDDITFSGGDAAAFLDFEVRKILMANGHVLADSKTRIFKRHQRKHVTGVILWENSIRVPNIRFKKARLIQAAVYSASDPEVKLSLLRKLGGLLGEAAYLDSRYKNWARSVYRKLQ